ncbi:MAG: HD domain-containing protein [Candidatus Falkowbacteria bacterium]
MKAKYQKIWKLALPYLKSGYRKNFVLHTEGVVKATEIIINLSGKGDESLLIPAAILHDTGWFKVLKDLQMSNDKKDKIKALKLHIKYAPEVIRKILEKVKYENKKINKIVEIVKSHKFKNPKDINKRILIDADALVDVFKKQFESDMKSYNTSRKDSYDFRKKNKFYTKIAKQIFIKELNKRLQI